MKRLTRFVIALVAVMLALAVAAPSAHAAGAVDTLTIDSSINQDGSINVVQTMTFQGDVGDVEQRFALVRAEGDKRYRFTLSDITATAADGTPVALSTTTQGDYLVLAFNPSGTESVAVSYTVGGAAVERVDKSVSVQWRYLQGLNVPVASVRGSVKVPGLMSMVDCQSGPPAALDTCQMIEGGTDRHRTPVFRDGARGVGEVVEVTVRFDEGMVAPNQDVYQVWTLARAFTFGWLQLGVAAGILAAAGILFLFLHFKYGKDAQAHAEPLVVAEFKAVGKGQLEFVPNHDVRPGAIGTVVDEHVDPIDITATLIDLAVRGHLLITEVPRKTEFSRGDWTFTRRESNDRLSRYERTLLDAVAPEGGSTNVSDMGKTVTSVIGEVQSELYQHVVDRGWFTGRPDQVRKKWARSGLAVSVVAGSVAAGLVAFTTFGIPGLALVLVAAGWIYVADHMPARTAEGAALLNGLALLRMQLLSVPTDQVMGEREYEELSKVLPFAIVLGGADRWTSALVLADTDDEADSYDLDWYHAPENWHLADLPASLDNFVTVVHGVMFKR